MSANIKRNGYLTMLGNPAILCLLLALGLLVTHLRFAPNSGDIFQSERVFDMSLDMSFSAPDDDVVVETFLPQSDDRQEVIKEHVFSGRLKFGELQDPGGRKGHWEGQTSDQIRYTALLSMHPIQYTIDADLLFPSFVEPWLSPYLEETEGIQVSHKEVKSLWATIAPDDKEHVLPTLKAIFAYTYGEIEGAPFKGYTDALTTLRLKRASCNGKGRLFVALARLNNIPARLVGGVILNGKTKKTSHQWVEVYLLDHWVPFDPTNGHFATLPDNYLQLYVGDLALFSHTRNINFDYRFHNDTALLSKALFRFDDDGKPGLEVNAAKLIAMTGLNTKAVGTFLLFPLGALIIAFLRNIVGIKTFGTFMPMLVGAACVQTGLVVGLSAFIFVVFFAYVSYAWLDRHKLLRVPKLAAIITLCTLLFVGAVWFFRNSNIIAFGVLALFPVVIISFLAERIHGMAEEQDWQDLVKSALGAIFATTLCYLAFLSFLLQSLFALYPEVFLAVLAGQIAVGHWSGMRLSEYIRFRSIPLRHSVLGINSRNRDYIYSLNSRELLELAADKLGTKQILSAANVPVPETLAVCEGFRELSDFEARIESLSAFALKPNRGSQGKGIVIVRDRVDDKFLSTKSRCLSLKDLSQHTAEILHGSYSQDGEEDTAYLEPLIFQIDALQALSPDGLSDIRIILHQGSPVSAMLRIPTKDSDGKANLHQGAVGVALDLTTGRALSASIGNKTLVEHPDTNASLIGFEVPYWIQIVEIARAASRAIPLGYIGVDICIDRDVGPLVLEVNGRPGIEIQNVHGRGLRDALESSV